MRPQSLLVVDDNRDDVFLLQHALRAQGIINPLQVVDNGADAIEYLEGSGKYADRSRYPYPAFLILDLHLPFKTGFNVLEWIRENPQPDLKVVVCTGTATPEEMKVAYQLGAERVFEKSPDFARFIRQFESIPGIHIENTEAERELVFD